MFLSYNPVDCENWVRGEAVQSRGSGFRRRMKSENILDMAKKKRNTLAELRGRLCHQYSPHRPSDSARSEEHTSELQSQSNLVCRLLLEKKKNKNHRPKQL